MCCPGNCQFNFLNENIFLNPLAETHLVNISSQYDTNMGCAFLVGRHDKPKSWVLENAVTEFQLKKKKKKTQGQERAPNVMSWPLLNVPFEGREQKTTAEAQGCTSPARERGRAYSGSIQLPVSPGKGPKTCLLPQIYYRSMDLLTATGSTLSSSFA